MLHGYNLLNLDNTCGWHPLNLYLLVVTHCVGCQLFFFNKNILLMWVIQNLNSAIVLFKPQLNILKKTSHIQMI